LVVTPTINVIVSQLKSESKGQARAPEGADAFALLGNVVRRFADDGEPRRESFPT
jgi:hypothetical protein